MPTDAEFTEQRNDAIREAVKGLFLMNGGGSVALLAFLQAIWSGKDNAILAKYIVLGISVMAAGVAFAGVVHFIRYHTAFQFQGRGFVKYRRLYLGCGYLSLICFIVGLGVAMCGAWKSL